MKYSREQTELNECDACRNEYGIYIRRFNLTLCKKCTEEMIREDKYE